jgi:hypothetical protein
VFFCKVGICFKSIVQIKISGFRELKTLTQLHRLNCDSPISVRNAMFIDVYAVRGCVREYLTKFKDKFSHRN